MRRIVLGVTAALLATFLVAFNYLLWERETFLKNEASQDSEVTGLIRDKRSLEIEAADAKSRLDVMEKSTEQARKDRDDAKTALLSAQTHSGEFETRLASVLPLVDTKVFETVMTSWCQSIENARWKEAYAYVDNRSGAFEGMTENGFTELFKASIKKVGWSEIKRVDPKLIVSSGHDLVFQMELEIQKSSEKPVFKPFSEGSGTYFVHFSADSEKNSWKLSDFIRTQNTKK